METARRSPTAGPSRLSRPPHDDFESGSEYHEGGSDDAEGDSDDLEGVAEATLPTNPSLGPSTQREGLEGGQKGKQPVRPRPKPRLGTGTTVPVPPSENTRGNSVHREAEPARGDTPVGVRPPALDVDPPTMVASTAPSTPSEQPGSPVAGTPSATPGPRTTATVAHAASWDPTDQLQTYLTGGHHGDGIGPAPSDGPSSADVAARTGADRGRVQALDTEGGSSAPDALPSSPDVRQPSPSTVSNAAHIQELHGTSPAATDAPSDLDIALDDAPQWVRGAVEFFLQVSTNARWRSLVRGWVELERAHGFPDSTVRLKVPRHSTAVN